MSNLGCLEHTRQENFKNHTRFCDIQASMIIDTNRQFLHRRVWIWLVLIMSINSQNSMISQWIWFTTDIQQCYVNSIAQQTSLS